VDDAQASLRQCSVALVVIGPRWLADGAGGNRYLDDPTDLVRQEVEAALAFGLVVIPVLVEDARMPGAAELPRSLKPLALINGVAVRNDPAFSRDMDRLIAALDRVRAQKPPVTSQPRAVAASGAHPIPAASRRSLSAGLAAALVVVVALGALLATKLPQGTGGAAKQPTATATTKTGPAPTPRPQASFPYTAAALGTSCDTQGAQWVLSPDPLGDRTVAHPSTIFQCLHNPDRAELTVDVCAPECYASISWSVAPLSFPANSTFSITLSNISQKAENIGSAVNWVTSNRNVGGDMSFNFQSDGSYIADDGSPSGQDDSTTGTVDPHSPIKLSISVSGTTARCSVNNKTILTHTMPSDFAPNFVGFGLSGSVNTASTDFSNFSITQ
jgi:hypothetical protein